MAMNIQETSKSYLEFHHTKNSGFEARSSSSSMTPGHHWMVEIVCNCPRSFKGSHELEKVLKVLADLPDMIDANPGVDICGVPGPISSETIRSWRPVLAKAYNDKCSAFTDLASNDVNILTLGPSRRPKRS
jgi:hypothetical protein